MTGIDKAQHIVDDMDIASEKPAAQANEKQSVSNDKQDIGNVQEAPNHSTFKVIVISTALMMATFLVALDTNILGT